MRKVYRGWMIGALLLLSTQAAHAQWAVVDVGAIAQLVQQVATLREQLETARNQLRQAQQQYESMTGGRGMERLAAGAVRNYLPPDWAALDAALRGAGAYGRDIDALATANAVLNAQFLSSLSPEVRAQLEAARRAAAMQQVISRRALESASQRFESLQELIDAVARAPDSKAALDLQARTAAEVAMLSNEQTKLFATFQAAQAEAMARQQRTRELAMASIGSLRRQPALEL